MSKKAMSKKSKKHPEREKSRTKVPWTMLLIFVLALAVRLVYLAQISKSPAFQVPIIDSATYDQHARLLLSQGAFPQQFFWQGFFYPFFLAVVYFFTGGSIVAARLIQTVLGSLLCVGVFELGSRFVDRRTGATAGIIAALYGPLVFFDVELLDAGFSAIWALVLIMVVLGAEGGGRPFTSLLFGVFGGLSVITRATFLPFFVAACVWLGLSHRRASAARMGTTRSAEPSGEHGSRADGGDAARAAGESGRRSGGETGRSAPGGAGRAAAAKGIAPHWGRGRVAAAKVGLAVAGFLLVTMPVADLCYRATGDFNFLAEAGPINLFIGNNPEDNRTIMIRPGAEWRELTRMPMVRGAGSDSEDRRVFLRLFFEYVASSPGRYLKGLALKTAQFFSSRELPRNDDLYVARDYSSLLSILVWKAGKFGFPFGLLLPLACIGLVRNYCRMPAPVYLFLVLYPASIIAVFVTGRYRMPIAPVLAIPAAAGLWFLIDLVRAKRHLFAAAVVCVVAAIGAASSIAGPFAVEKYDYRAELHSAVGFELMKEHRTEAAVREFSEALRLDPDFTEAHKYLGIIMSGERRHAEAERHLRAALAQEPDSYLLQYYLGVTLLNLGKKEEAEQLLRQARGGAVFAKEDRLVEEIDRLLRAAAGTR
jgi:tetratricopeptide (TPR) repeat protein